MTNDARAQVPAHVLAAFQVDDTATPVALGAPWGNGWRMGAIVLAPAVGPQVMWSARVRERLQVPGVQVVRPVRATDGRFLSAGWRANQFVAGSPQARVDEVVAAGLRLEEALAAVVSGSAARPESDADDVFCAADRAAWAPPEERVLDGVEDGLARDLLVQLRAAMEPVAGSPVAGHADLLATTLFAPSRPPIVTDLVGVWHPRGYTAAQVIVDGLLAEAVDGGVIARNRHIDQLDQLLVRAAAYRVWVHVLLPDPNPKASSKLAGMVGHVLSRVSGSL
ncbi:hypothetical protein CATYP_02860 [Corynebacterium atypicum]|uniref:TIGR02569 family protein n=1 Tax=Corynebacterium atypicum TaxID=191610 RepID=A0ABM5QLY6_9CORY|nr:TIGR02569 family protein [Corynebacterium atypicum]AIG63799.1 hypothetical protein CATYP_02860 [Corynebacterium atypicum]